MAVCNSDQVLWVMTEFTALGEALKLFTGMQLMTSPYLSKYEVLLMCGN
jgi:hypothetical protein